MVREWRIDLNNQYSGYCFNYSANNDKYTAISGKYNSHGATFARHARLRAQIIKCT